MTGVFAEMPYFVSQLGGDKTLYSTLDLAVQGANVVPAAIVVSGLFSCRRGGRCALRDADKEPSRKKSNMILVGVLYAIAMVSWGILSHAAKLVDESVVEAATVRSLLFSIRGRWSRRIIIVVSFCLGRAKLLEWIRCAVNWYRHVWRYHAVPSCHSGTRGQCASLLLCSNILHNMPLHPRSICGRFRDVANAKGHLGLCQRSCGAK